MKKTKFLKIAFIFLGLIFSGSTISASCFDLKSGQDVNRGKLVSSEYLCIENFKLSPEEEIILENGEKAYKKSLNVEKEYKSYYDKGDQETKGYLNFDVTFTYDKKSYAKAESRDVKSIKDSKIWKIRDLPESYPAGDVQLVSNRYSFYEKTFGGVGDYLFDGHIDVMCSCNGEVCANTELC